MNQNLKGLYLITDKKLINRNTFFETIEKAVRGGTSILQLREKDTPKHEVISIAKKTLEITKKFNIPLIINDSPEIAKVSGADGVHLGQSDPQVNNAREMLGNDAIIGVSCYGEINRGIKARENGADYLAFGTPYFTPTKPDREPTTLQTIKEARTILNDIPVFAIGGINIDNAQEILNTGVDGIAVITAVFGSDDPEKASRQLSSLFKS